MKILFVSSGTNPDYLCDMALHGMKRLFGPDVVDVNPVPFIYQSFKNKHELYGKGFTLYGLLPEYPVDRTDILHKIKKKYFDLVIFGSIHREHAFLHDVIDVYRRNEVIFLDGEDHPLFLREKSEDRQSFCQTGIIQLLQ